MRTYNINSFSTGVINIDGIQILTLPIPLPDAETFVSNAYNIAYPQVLAFCAALIAITFITLMLKSFNE